MEELMEELDPVYYRESVDAIVEHALTSDSLEIRTRATYVKKVNEALIVESERESSGS